MVLKEKEQLELVMDLKIFNLEKFLIPPHPLTNFEIQKYYHNESRVYSRDNLPDKMKDGAFVINLDEHFEIRTHWIALYKLNNSVTYFDRFRVEHTPKEIKYLSRIKI